MTTTRDQVIAEARTWLRTPWRHMGDIKGPAGGVDCLMLLARVFGAVGAVPADVEPRPYPIDWHLHRTEERYRDGLLAWCDELPEGATPEPSDIVLYRVGRCFAHGALVVEWPGTIIHAFRGEGVVIGRGDGGVLADRAWRAFRVRGVVAGEGA